MESPFEPVLSQVDQQGFSLAGPKYFARFVETCSDFVRESGVTFFKFDGIAGGFVSAQMPHARQLPDVRTLVENVSRVDITKGIYCGFLCIFCEFLNRLNHEI